MIAKPRPVLGIRSKLILLFVLIKIVPLAGLAWYAWRQAEDLGNYLLSFSDSMTQTLRGIIHEGGKMVVTDATRALDMQARDTIEHLTTETARHMARFLYDRDQDIRYAAQLPVTEDDYRRFLSSRMGSLVQAGPYRLNETATEWVAETLHPPADLAESTVSDNDRDFHSRPPDHHQRQHWQPLYLEMSFVTPDGQERLRVGPDAQARLPLRNVADPRNTYAKAEDYFRHLRALKPGEIYVSKVIGPYVRSSVIGPYTPQSAAKAGQSFHPEHSAYAGRENPYGQRFQGLVRWAMPVHRQGQLIGYVTMALDHRHIMEFTDILVPTAERLREISDASEGNYAMTLAASGEVIAHPRHYTIVGYDPASGQMVEPWMDTDLYQQWRASNAPFQSFQQTIPAYQDPSLARKPSSEQIAAGTLAVYCGYSNFAPQCAGWRDLVEKGGSGSFQIFWSGLWKLSTAAAIPYYTGQYGRSQIGFGWVSITANLDEFHRAATDSKIRMQALLDASQADMDRRNADMQAAIANHVRKTLSDLLGSTALMMAAVIGIAVWLASRLTRRIQELVTGIRKMERGENQIRLPIYGNDELGQVSASFNAMADRVSESMRDLADKNAELHKIAYVSSHDLQEPLRSIVSFSQLVQRRHAEQLDEDGRQYLTFVVRAALRMRQLVGGLRQFVEAITEPAVCHSVHCDDLVRECVAAQNDRLAEVNGHVHVQPLPVVHADRNRLAMIFSQLIDNAVRYRHATRPLTLYITARQQDDEWIFSVQDNGLGIESVYFDRIFQLFEKIPSPHDGISTGIGLALCAKLARSQGGRIWVESEPDHGSTFFVTVPVFPPSAASPP